MYIYAYNTINNLLQCFLLLWTEEKFWQPFFREIVPVMYEQAGSGGCYEYRPVTYEKLIFHS